MGGSEWSWVEVDGASWRWIELGGCGCTVQQYPGRPNNISIFLIKKYSLIRIRVLIQLQWNCGCLVSSDLFRRDFFDTT